MSHCAFIYTPHLKESDIHLWLEVLSAIGVTITHLGKSDPPKRWTGDHGSALAAILTGNDLTNYTFLRDNTAHIHFDIQLHRDPRWESDTISFSGGAGSRLTEIANKISESLTCYAAIVGISGGGKNQEWQIVHLSPDCPTSLRNKFTKAEQGAAANP